MSDADFDLGGSPSVIDTTVSDTRPLEEDNVFNVYLQRGEGEMEGSVLD